MKVDLAKGARVIFQLEETARRTIGYNTISNSAVVRCNTGEFAWNITIKYECVIL